MGSPPHGKKPSRMARVKRRLRSKVSLLPVCVVAAIVVTMGVPMYKLYNRVYSQAGPGEFIPEGEEELQLLPLYRELFVQESWPGVQWDDTELSSQVPTTVHYVWCGQKVFRLQDYLGVLSILRVIQPLKLVFHYTHLPLSDPLWYHTWFQELRQSAHNLELRRLWTDASCGSVSMLREGLKLLSVRGGIYVGERVVLARDIERLKMLPFWFAFADPAKDPTRGLVWVNTGFNQHTLEDYVQTILANSASCLTVDDYDRLESEEKDSLALCISLTQDVYPRDFRSSDTAWSELARWLFYGRRRPFSTPHSGQVSLVPRLAHYVWISPGPDLPPLTFTFAHYLSVLSALHVAQMQQVYVHGDVEPEGVWWEALRTENVSFLPLDLPSSIFQQAIVVPAHASDVVRYNVLYKYGGVYQDIDVLWVNKLPDWLLGYPAVACPEWPRYGDWPDALNLGVMLARSHSPFLRHLLSTYRYFRDDEWNFNAVLMPYRTYERYPDTLFLDQFLQAICSHGLCHPAWMDDTATDSDPDDLVKRQSAPFNLREVRAVHFREPKTPPSLMSPDDLNRTSDMFADIGRYILRQANREDLLKGTVDGGDDADAVLAASAG